jgi:hypothetical protein
LPPVLCPWDYQHFGELHDILHYQTGEDRSNLRFSNLLLEGAAHHRLGQSNLEMCCLKLQIIHTRWPVSLTLLVVKVLSDRATEMDASNALERWQETGRRLSPRVEASKNVSAEVIGGQDRGFPQAIVYFGEHCPDFSPV